MKTKKQKMGKKRRCSSSAAGVNHAALTQKTELLWSCVPLSSTAGPPPPGGTLSAQTLQRSDSSLSRQQATPTATPDTPTRTLTQTLHLENIVRSRWSHDSVNLQTIAMCYFYKDGSFLSGEIHPLRPPSCAKDLRGSCWHTSGLIQVNLL